LITTVIQHGPIRRWRDSSCSSIPDLDEVHNWSASLNVTPQQLTDAVERIGTSASKVRKHLQGT
jgi:hypothetical protein